MKKKNLKLFAGIVVLLTALCLCTFASALTIAQGSCGPNATWTMDDEGVLTISGNGATTSHDWTNEFPTANGDSVKKVIINGGIESLAEASFTACHDLTSVTFPSSLTQIGKGAFRNCKSLTSVTLPDGLERIEEDTFTGCISLTSVSIQKNVTYIGPFAFNGCTALQGFIVPNTVTEMGNSAFMGCTGIKSFTFSSNMSTVPNSALYGCTGLTSVTLPPKTTKIARNAFQECTALQSISIPDGVREIELYAFYKCKSLKSIKLPGSLQTLGKGTFDSCSSLSTVTVPLGLNSIGDNAFVNCTALSKITVPVRNTYAVKWFKDNGFTSALSITKDKITDCSFSTVKNQVYTGKEIKPTVKVTAKDGTVLKCNTDYTIAYKNNKNIGLATITIKGKGNYTGTKTLQFKILPKATAISSIASKAKQQMTLSWKKSSIVSGYQIEYSLKSDFSNSKKVTIKKADTVKTTVKGLKSGKKYYVRVRTWKKVDNVNYFSAWSEKKAVKIK